MSSGPQSMGSIWAAMGEGVVSIYLLNRTLTPLLLLMTQLRVAKTANLHSVHL
jgi:hypothetical protein